MAGIRVVAEGEALLAPSITRRLIEEFAQRRARRRPSRRRGLDELTARELEVLRLAGPRALQRRDRRGARRLARRRSRPTSRGVLMKLGLRDRVQAVVLAYESGVAVPGRSG